MKQNVIIFICRWFANSLMLWILISIFGQAGYSADAGTYFLAGLIFSLVNSILRPILTILSLPAIMLTLGLFTLVVNGLILWIAIAIAPDVEMTLWNAIVAGAVMSLVNYAINSYAYKNIEEEM